MKKRPIKDVAASVRQRLINHAKADNAVEALAPYAAVIPADLIPDYVSAITLTYVGHMGYSCQWSRRDFYANRAALRIPEMVEKFDDKAAYAFVEVIRTNNTLRDRIQDETKFGRLRTLGEIVLGRVSATFPDKMLLAAMVDPAQKCEFWKLAK